MSDDNTNDFEFREIWIEHLINEYNRARELAKNMSDFGFDIIRKTEESNYTQVRLDYGGFLLAMKDNAEAHQILNSLLEEMLGYIRELRTKHGE
jgi:hypothetical protein